jgi:hypothetical protein
MGSEYEGEEESQGQDKVKTKDSQDNSIQGSLSAQA